MNNLRKILEGQFRKLEEAGTEEAAGGSANAAGTREVPPSNTNSANHQDDDAGNEDESGDDPQDSKWDESTKAYIKKLRAENAKYRTGKKESEEKVNQFSETLNKVKEAFGLGEDDMSLEDKVALAQETVSEQEFRLAVRDLAIEGGISGKESFEYFEFLMQKAANNLGDDGEITEDEITEMVKKAQSFGGKGQSGKFQSSIADKGTGGSSGNPTPNTGDALGVDDFAKMTFTEKGQLFAQNPDLYKKLNAEATAKNLI